MKVQFRHHRQLLFQSRRDRIRKPMSDSCFHPNLNPAKAAKSNQVNGNIVIPPRQVFHRKSLSALIKQFVFLDKIIAFLQSARSKLPVIAVDLPSSSLAHLALNPGWITDDEAWKQVLADPAVDDRKYAETIREAVRKIVKEESQSVIWLFGVREGKVRLI